MQLMSKLLDLLNEELGPPPRHNFQSKDTPGDEGAVFSLLLKSAPESTASITQIKNEQKENDHGWISVDGQLLEAEFGEWVTNGGVGPTDGDDNYNGDSSDETIYGLGGADFLKGGGGSDYIYGGGGADKIRGKWTGDLAEANNDFNYLFGGEGNDTIWGASKKTSCVAMEISGQESSDNEGNDDLEGNGGK